MTTSEPLWPETRIASWQEFHKTVTRIGAHWPNSERCLFRGQGRSSWTLQPSLAREVVGRSIDWQRIARLEQHLAHRFRQDAHHTLPSAVLSVHDYILDWWPLMQHYGAPTRLLDWSLSPYVALYFAVVQHWEEDGAVWWFNASAADNLMTRHFGAEFVEQSKAALGSHDGAPFWEPPRNMIFSFELKRTVDRIGNQQGFFTVCLNASADHADVLSELVDYADGPHCGMLTIPKESKPEFLRELQLMNVTGKSMFPGLDGLGRTLAELSKLSLQFGLP